MAITINDVAKRAGVSAKTVSNVINQYPHVREATRLKVLEAVQELGYHPNIAARGLVTNRRNLIGCVLWDILNPAYTELVEIVVDKARASDYMTILGNVARDPAEEERLATLLIQQRVDGVLLASSTKNSQVPERLMDMGVPVVLVNRRVDHLTTDYVGVNDFRGGYIAARHLIGLGHRRIAFIRGMASVSTSVEREEGYRQALRDGGLEYDPALVADGGYTIKGAYDAARRLLSIDAPPTAFFCANDLMAISAIDAVIDAGQRVPEDVAVIGYDDIEFSGSRSLALTTVRFQMDRIAQEAVDMLLGRISGRIVGDPREVVFPPELVVRRTCGASLSGPRAAAS